MASRALNPRAAYNIKSWTNWGCICRSFASRVIVKEPFTAIAWRAIRNQLKKPSLKMPPYSHACQVGDPVLRSLTAEVDVKSIASKDIQNIIQIMIRVMRKGGNVGVAAPQIGISKQIIVMEFTEKHYRTWTHEMNQARETVVFPLKVFINPKLKILDSRQTTFPEGCLSVVGYQAQVPRAYEVEVSGYDDKGEHNAWRVKGYPARIIQHEYDHLYGTLFVDRMDITTFMDEHWVKWNFK